MGIGDCRFFGSVARAVSALQWIEAKWNQSCIIKWGKGVRSEDYLQKDESIYYKNKSYTEQQQTMTTERNKLVAELVLMLKREPLL